MPLIHFKSVRQQVRFSLGDDIFSPCIAELTLTAVPIKGDYFGHTFLWELYSGNAVTWTTPLNELSATCLLPSSTDRVFYFWVDKGTDDEQRYTVRYFGTAIDDLQNQHSSFNVVSSTFIDNSWAASITGVQLLLGQDRQGLSAVNPTELALIWALPTNVNGLRTLIVEQLINGVWTVVGQTQPQDVQQLSPIDTNSYYRIKTVYNLDHQRYIQYGSPYLVSLNVVDHTIYADEVLGQSSSLLANLVVSNYTLVNSDQVTDELVEQQLSSGTSLLPQVSLQNYTLVNTDNVTDELLEGAQVLGSSLLPMLSVTYLGGTIIGG